MTIKLHLRTTKDGTGMIYVPKHVMQFAGLKTGMELFFEADGKDRFSLRIDRI